MIRYHAILADPAWPYHDKLTMIDGVNRAAADHYDTMTVEEIKAYPYATAMIEGPGSPYNIAAYTAEDSLLFLWATNPVILEGHAVAVCKAWGYTPKQILTWVKGRLVDERLIYHMGMGAITRGVTEHLIIASRGESRWLLHNHSTLNYLEADNGLVVFAPRTAHSVKPLAIYTMIETMCRGPYLELFARKRRTGWTQIGNELV